MCTDMTALLTSSDVAARLRVSRRALFTMLARGDFVKPIYLGKRTMRFAEHEVDAWIAARLAERSSAM